MITSRLCAPVFKFAIGLFGTVQVAPTGVPELQAMDTLSGSAPVGATTAVKVAGTPAWTVTEAGVTASVKLLTTALALAVCGTKFAACGTLIDALFPSEPPVVGVRLTVTVLVADGLIAPRLQVTFPPLAPLQLPEVEVAEANVAPVIGSVSVNVTPLRKSPLLVMVYVKATGLPIPTGEGLAVAVKARFTRGETLLTNASVGPLKVP